MTMTPNRLEEIKVLIRQDERDKVPCSTRVYDRQDLVKEVEKLTAEKAELLAANEKLTKERDEALADAHDTAEDGPYVCPGCYATAEPCAPGCIDDEIRQEREEAMERDENGEEVDDG